MRFEPRLVEGTLVQRYKRFLADVILDGVSVTAHCPNTGGLIGCKAPGTPVLLQAASNPSRKLPWTWVGVRSATAWVGLDTGRAVPLVVESLSNGLLPELGGYERTLLEVPYGDERSRIDVLLSAGGTPPATRRERLWTGDRRTYVEVKNTTLASGRVARFPDAVTERGTKHLRELMRMVQAGHRAALVFVAQRDDVDSFEPADEIDPTYGKTLREACRAGVQTFAVAGPFAETGAVLDRRLKLSFVGSA